MIIKKYTTTYSRVLVAALAFFVCFSWALLLRAEQNTQDVSSLLSDMSQSLRKLDYQGRFVYLVDGDLKSFQIQHALIDDLEYERLVFLNKKQQEVVRIGHNIFCIHPGNVLLREHAALSSNPFQNKTVTVDEGLYSNYEVSLESGDIIAGYDTYLVKFKSRTDNLYDHSLWLDQRSKLLLKVVISDELLGVLESFEYVQITIGEKINKSEFEYKNSIHHNAEHFSADIEKTQDDVKQKNESTAWRVSWVPAGFSSSGRTQKRLKDQEKAVEMFMYSDGLSAISIFIDQVDQKNQFNESSQIGAISTYSHGLALGDNFYRVTVVGNIHLKAAERIAKGVVSP
jgi:sigma-E factor negative regulatory protein RseB